MKLTLLFLATLSCSVIAQTSCGVLNHNLRLLGEEDPTYLCHTFDAKAYLIVNTASQCAFTPQYGELESLYTKYKSQGLVILAFPSNDFFDQEPLTDTEIREFCDTEYDVSFPVFSKSRVIGDDANGLYKDLAAKAGPPRWNFYKYLVDQDGNVIQSYSSMTRPENKHLEHDIATLLSQRKR